MSGASGVHRLALSATLTQVSLSGDAASRQCGIAGVDVIYHTSPLLQQRHCFTRMDAT
jgi:hypothetical protein